MGSSRFGLRDCANIYRNCLVRHCVRKIWICRECKPSWRTSNSPIELSIPPVWTSLSSCMASTSCSTILTIPTSRIQWNVNYTSVLAALTALLWKAHLLSMIKILTVRFVAAKNLEVLQDMTLNIQRYAITGALLYTQPNGLGMPVSHFFSAPLLISLKGAINKLKTSKGFGREININIWYDHHVKHITHSYLSTITIICI